MRTWWRGPETLSSDWAEVCLQFGRLGRFDGVMGFSQGGMVAARLLAEKVLEVRFAVLAGAPAWPSTTVLPTIDVPSLHIMGQDDRVVPSTSSQQLASCFTCPERVFHMHVQGHCMPQKAVDLQVLFDFVRAHLPTAPESITRASVDPAVVATNHGAAANGITLDTTGAGEDTDQMAASNGAALDADDEVADELTALEAIFGEDFQLMGAHPPSCSILLGLNSLPAALAEVKLTLLFVLPPGYPHRCGPNLQARCEGISRQQGSSLAHDLCAHLVTKLPELLGQGMCFQLVEAACEWLRDFPLSHRPAVLHATEGSQAVLANESEGQANCIMADEEDDLPGEALMIAACTQEAAREEARLGLAQDTHTHGLSRFTVGLVGKPSAGKSTFFNAITDPVDESDGARIAAFPFTTIDPNLGTGFFEFLPPPNWVSPELAAKMDSTWGVTASGHHKVPIQIKDVAGLVPGAYQGKGRGNAFLNDLLESDVFIHIVDVSGTTDAGGAPTEACSPRQEITWVREELHRWIFANLRAKWASVCRRPGRIYDMFTGYHAKPALVTRALERAGVKLDTLDETLPYWDRRMLHSVVAHFLRVRFPILLALNKADLPTASAYIQELQALGLPDPMVPVSAQSEWQLCQLRRAGFIKYNDGERDFSVVPSRASELSGPQRKILADIRQKVLVPFGHTGVLAAVTAAVYLKAPTVVFPVDNLVSCIALPVGGVHRFKGSGVLAEPVLLRSGSNTLDLFQVLSHPPLVAVAGDYVRAEYLSEQGAMLLLRKDQVLSNGWVCRVMTNRKVSWQKKPVTTGT